MDLGAIFFDLDETLVSYEAAEEAGFSASEARLKALRPGLPAGRLRDEALRTYFARFAPGMPEFSRLATLPTRTLRRELTASALAALNVADKALLEALLDAYEAAYESSFSVYPDVLPTLDALKSHFRLGIITNGPGPMQREKLEKFGLTHYFDPILVDTEVGVSKPDTAIFRHAERLAQLPPERLLFVGNDLEADVGGARAAGWQNIWIKRGDSSLQENRGGIVAITRLAELLSQEKILAIVRGGEICRYNGNR